MNIDDILKVDVMPLLSISTSGPDMSVITSVELGTSMAVDFDDRSREIQDTAAAMLELGDKVGARRFRNPSLAPNVGRARLGESSLGTHPPTAQGYTSLGMVPSTALGGYTVSDDIAQFQIYKSNMVYDCHFEKINAIIPNAIKSIFSIKSNMANHAILEMKNCDISTTVSPIFTKFCVVMHRPGSRALKLGGGAKSNLARLNRAAIIVGNEISLVGVLGCFEQ